jgi:hypothetical protein
MLRKYLGLRGMIKKGSGENCLKRRFMLSTPQEILLFR